MRATVVAASVLLLVIPTLTIVASNEDPCGAHSPCSTQSDEHMMLQLLAARKSASDLTLQESAKGLSSAVATQGFELEAGLRPSSQWRKASKKETPTTKTTFPCGTTTSTPCDDTTTPCTATTATCVPT